MKIIWLLKIKNFQIICEGQEIENIHVISFFKYIYFFHICFNMRGWGQILLNSLQTLNLSHKIVLESSCTVQSIEVFTCRKYSDVQVSVCLNNSTVNMS